jgi:tetratricopeptide (TPR) repeat protein
MARLTLFLGSLLLLSGFAFAQTQDQNWLRCKDYAPAVALEGCNAVIAARTESVMGLADAFYFRGFANLRAGNVEQAAADFTQAARLDTTDNGPIFGHGAAMYQMGRYDEALRDLNLAVTRNPRYAEALYVRGLVRRHMGDRNGADADFETATGMRGDITRTVHDLGVAP